MNNNVVQPVVNFVYTKVVQPVVVPLLKNVVIPYAKAYCNGLVADYNTVAYVGNQKWKWVSDH